MESVTKTYYAPEAPAPLFKRGVGVEMTKLIRIVGLIAQRILSPRIQ